MTTVCGSVSGAKYCYERAQRRAARDQEHDEDLIFYGADRVRAGQYLSCPISGRAMIPVAAMALMMGISALLRAACVTGRSASVRVSPRAS